MQLGGEEDMSIPRRDTTLQSHKLFNKDQYSFQQSSDFVFVYYLYPYLDLLNQAFAFGTKKVA